MFETPVLAYVASIIDTQGIIRIRTAGDTELGWSIPDVFEQRRSA